jgi:hypothetical protein
MEHIRFAHALTPGLNQHPDRNPGSDNAGYATANIGIGINAGKGIANIPRYPLQKLSLFRTGHAGEKMFSLFQNVHHGFLPQKSKLPGSGE